MQPGKQKISRFEVTRGLKEVKPQPFYEVVRPWLWLDDAKFKMLQFKLSDRDVDNHVQCSTPPLIVCLF